MSEISHPSRSPRRSARGLVIASLLLVFGYLVHSFIAPLLLGGVFAVVVYPLYLRVNQKLKIEYLSASTVTFLFAVLFLAPIVGLVITGTRAAVDQIRPFMEEGDSLRQVEENLIEKIDGISEFLPLTEDELKEVVISGASRVGKFTLEMLQKFLSQIPMVTISTLVILVSLLCFLVQGPAIIQFFRSISVFSQENTDRVLATVQQSCRSSILASMVTGLIQASIMGVGAAALGASSVVLVALSTLLFSFVPVFGTAPVSMGLAGYFFLMGDPVRCGLALGLGVLTGLVDNFVRPVLLGEGISIHPLAAFVFTFGALEMIGFYGLFLGPVAAGMFFTLLNLIPRKETTRHVPASPAL